MIQHINKKFARQGLCPHLTMPDFQFYPNLSLPALVVAGGQEPEASFLRGLAQKAQAIYAADSGLYHLQNLKIPPSTWIGDHDSYRGELPVGTKIRSFAQDKDASDTQLALEQAVSDGWDRIGLIAARGSRMDHSLANMLILAHYPLRAFLLEPGQWLTVQAAGQRLTLTGFCDYTLSLFAMGERAQGIDLQGVKWPLAEAELVPGSQGLSNIVVQDQALLSLQKGRVWLALTDLKTVQDP